jgi:hypothetical protein
MRWLDRYLDTIITLDPSFRRPYRWAGVITLYNGRVITNDMVRASNHYLELATERFPRDWEFPFMLGCNYLNELKPSRPEQKDEWRRIAAEYIRRAAVLGGGPTWLPLLAASIYTREGETDLAIRHLEEMYASSEDPTVREQIRARLAALQKSGANERRERARAEFERRRKAWAPYAPADLYVLVGEPPPDLDLPHLTDEPLLAGPEEPTSANPAGAAPSTP